jgi:alanine dehydrogenase
MIIGIPREHEALKGVEEKRVGLSPSGVREVASLGAEIFITSDAGASAGFLNREYRSAGAHVVYSNEEVIRRADVVVQFGRPSESDCTFFKERSLLLSFLHLGVAKPSLIRSLIDSKVTAIGHEIVQTDEGTLPILRVFSEIAGKMAPHLAGRLLENTYGGRGVLLGGTPGIPPADVTILGAGTLGYYAARSFLGLGASVYVLDHNLANLSRMDQLLQGRVVTSLANQTNIEKCVTFADVVIGAVLVPGQPAPVLVTKEMVSQMNTGSVIIDFSIDQGGCVETSRLTPNEDFLFTEQGVIHFCAPNVTSMVARTSSYALTNALLPYLKSIVQDDVAATLVQERSLRRGLYTFNGFASEQLPFSDLPKANLEQAVDEME